MSKDELRPAVEVWDGALSAYWISDNSVTDALGYAAATAIIEADRAAVREAAERDTVQKIVAWLREDRPASGAYHSSIVDREYREEFADTIEAGEWKK